MTEDAEFAPYRPLAFGVRGTFCTGDECRVSPELLALSFEVEKVFGTSPTVGEGERYVVSGRYKLAGEDVFTLSIAVFTKSFGAAAHVLPGAGRFEVSTEILDLSDSPPNGLGIVVGNDRTGKCELVRWVMLAQ